MALIRGGFANSVDGEQLGSLQLDIVVGSVSPEPVANEGSIYTYIFTDT